MQIRCLFSGSLTMDSVSFGSRRGGEVSNIEIHSSDTHLHPDDDHRLCVAGGTNSSTGDTNLTIISSAEQYFKRGVLKEETDLTKGLGLPDLELALCLAGCWVLLFLTMWKGVASSGKVFILSTPIINWTISSSGCLLHSHIPLCGFDHTPRPRINPAWRHGRCLVLHHTKVVRASQSEGQPN